MMSLNNPYFNDCVHLVHHSELEIKILLKVVGLFHILIFSSILTQMDDFKLKPMTTAMNFPIANLPFLNRIKVLTKIPNSSSPFHKKS